MPGGFCQGGLSRTGKFAMHILRPCEETVAGASDDEACEDGIEGGIRFTKKLKDSRMPIMDEIAEHQMKLPYRDSCRHRVRGRGREMPHRASHEGPGLPEAHLYFCFMGGETEAG